MASSLPIHPAQDCPSCCGDQCRGYALFQIHERWWALRGWSIKDGDPPIHDAFAVRFGSLADAESSLAHLDLTFIPRKHYDDPCLVGNWV